MEIGTSCIFSVRRCAVTMTSAIPSLVDSLVLGVCSCAEAATAVPPRMAATAYEIFDFICLPLPKHTASRLHRRLCSQPIGYDAPGFRLNIHVTWMVRARTRRVAGAEAIGVQSKTRARA